MMSEAPAGTTQAPLAVIAEIAKISRKDMRAAAMTLGDAEARYLVDLYYQAQDMRIAANNQLKAATKAAEPCEAIGLIRAQFDTVEDNIRLALDLYTDAHPIARRARTVLGVGPVISAGLISSLSIELVERPEKGEEFPEGYVPKRTPINAVGAWWRFCGLDPTSHWGKGEKRPWNAQLKRLCWLLGESFVKVKGREGAFYGELYTVAREKYGAINDAFGYRPECERRLAEKHLRGMDASLRALLETGKLPDKAMHERAKRYAVKIFLSHLHAVWFLDYFGTLPPKPYVIEMLGHKDFMPPTF